MEMTQHYLYLGNANLLMTYLEQLNIGEVGILMQKLLSCFQYLGLNRCLPTPEGDSEATCTLLN